jgi:hypothetical protein
METRITELLGIEYPIVQGMAWGQVYFIGMTSGEKSPGAVFKFELGCHP